MSQHNGDHQSSEPAAEALTALALNQLHGEELAAAEAQLAADGDAAQRERREIQSLAAALAAARNADPLPQSSAELRTAIEERFGKVELPQRRRRSINVAIVLTACSLAAVVCAVIVSAVQSQREAARQMNAGNVVKQLATAQPSSVAAEPLERHSLQGHSLLTDMYGDDHRAQTNFLDPYPLDAQGSGQPTAQGTGSGSLAGNDKPLFDAGLQDALQQRGRQAQPVDYGRYPAVGGVLIGGAGLPPSDNYASSRSALSKEESETLRELAKQIRPRSWASQEGQGDPAKNAENGKELDALVFGLTDRVRRGEATGEEIALLSTITKRSGTAPGTEQYDRIIENPFLSPRQQPLSTFSIDVDTASYSNVRRFLTSGRLPPANAVRIEELVNYFKYDYPQPTGREPFSVNMEVAQCPWTLTPALSQGEREPNRGHLLLRVGLKGKDVAKAERPASNLVFLLDVSGSMSDENKLPLLKTAMKMLAGELGENDRVSIVTYAGEAGLRLPPTRGHERAKLNAAIDSLSAGGSTNGSAGINLAYEQAAAYFVKGGTNRVILCTDGDLNVGVTSDDALVELIKQQAAGGTFLTVLGFGEGNLKDAKLEKLADNGNGLFAYIDSVREARKVLVEQLTGSTITIAKDVKIQIEFNPQEIAAYRLLGYENRLLAAEDFNNDKKDAGEIGAGHTVTALYELVPAGAAEEPAVRPVAEPLKYQRVQGSGFGVQDGNEITDDRSPTTDDRLTAAAKSGELLTLKLCYKEPDGVESRMIEFPLKDRGGSFQAASRDLQFAASVASFGMILRGSQHRGSGNLAAVLEIASTSLGDDPGGYRAEFVDLVRRAQALGAK